MKRLAEQKTKMLKPHYPGMICDTILQKLYSDTLEIGFHGPRHCLVLWACPPVSIKCLIMMIQIKLLAVASSTLYMHLY